MKIHIISDTHLEHKNIKAYTNRPDDWEDKITTNLHELETDLLIHLGDVSLGSDAGWHNFVTNGGSLDFKSWLILGNHDGKSMTWYMNYGWDFVARNFTMYIYGLRILFSHRPYPFPPMKMITKELTRDANGAEIIIDKHRSNFDINVCGHIHNRTDIQLEDWQKPFILENQDYKPIELKEFLSEEINQKQSALQKER